RQFPQRAIAPGRALADRCRPPQTARRRRFSSQLRHVLAQDLPHFFELGPPLERIAHVSQRAGDVRQEGWVLLHPVDEYEPAGVLELALHRSEEHTSELQSLAYLVCRLLLEKK